MGPGAVLRGVAGPLALRTATATGELPSVADQVLLLQREARGCQRTLGGGAFGEAESKMESGS